ncbi:MAG: hypothetical protein KDC25_08440 [Saprospiraceae bacterium]|nr:hypothetical protein [Saprospiraceae bacterium]
MEIYSPITVYFRPTLSIVVLLKNIGFVHNLAENTVKQPILHITYSEILVHPASKTRICQNVAKNEWH